MRPIVLRPVVTDTLAVLLVLAAALAVILHTYGCTPPASKASAAAEGAYTSSLLLCVQQANTLAESKACRQRVDREWGIVQYAPEGGAR